MPRPACAASSLARCDARCGVIVDADVQPALVVDRDERVAAVGIVLVGRKEAEARHQPLRDPPVVAVRPTSRRVATYKPGRRTRRHDFRMPVARSIARLAGSRLSRGSSATEWRCRKTRMNERAPFLACRYSIPGALGDRSDGRAAPGSIRRRALRASCPPDEIGPDHPGELDTDTTEPEGSCACRTPPAPRQIHARPVTSYFHPW